jgi:hypothetical protein
VETFRNQHAQRLEEGKTNYQHYQVSSKGVALEIFEDYGNIQKRACSKVGRRKN